MAVGGKTSERDRADLEAGEVTDDKFQNIWELENNARAARDLSFGEVKGEPVYQSAQLPVADSAAAIDDRNAPRIQLYRAVESVSKGHSRPVTPLAVQPSEIIRPRNHSL